MKRPELIPLRDATILKEAGGKASRLAQLIAGGYPVPDGFVVTTEGIRRSASDKAWNGKLEEWIAEAWREMGSPPVAVRSSATAEDSGDASMAGQYETFLNLRTEEEVVEAVAKCRAAAGSERATAYLRQRGLEPEDSAMAVLVQKMVAADVAGVAFSLDPRTGDAGVVVIESAWGLGEAVVSGAVQPDVFRVDKDGERVEVIPGEKCVWFNPKAMGKEPEPLDEGRRRKVSLTDAQAVEVARWAVRLEKDADGPVDVEWAYEGGQCFLLQVRPVTASGGSQAVTVRHVVKELREALAKGEGPWVRHNLGETLPRPRPLTWSVMRRFMSARGGYGAMVREAGFSPSARLGDESFLRLIAGRIYMDVERAVEMLEEGHGFGYDSERLRRDPGAAQDAPTRPRGGWGARRKAVALHERVRRRCQRLARTLPDELRGRDFPEFLGWCEAEEGRALTEDGEEWVRLWQEQETRVWDEFGARAFLPTLVLASALGRLREVLARHFWREDTERLIEVLSVSHEGDSAVKLQAGLQAWGRGGMREEEWMKVFGDRGAGEMDLAEPRWREQPEAARKAARAAAEGGDVWERHRHRVEEARALEERLLSQVEGEAKSEVATTLAEVQALLPFREDAKEVLMRGHGLLRTLALEAGRRLGIGDQVFYLDRETLFAAMRAGRVDCGGVEAREREWRSWGDLEPPGFLDHEGLVGWENGKRAKGAPGVRSLTRGRAGGPALVLERPEDGADAPAGFVLVCPSTDTAWTPLFARASALVLERGGMLSHGAVVAREMGLPAVVMEGACRRFFGVPWLTVDADSGTVVEGRDPKPDVGLEDEERVLPIPPPADREVRWQRRAGWAAAGWVVVLVLGWVLPGEWLAYPAMRLGDLLLWPVLRELGMAGGVAAIAVLTAGAVLGVQAVLTDVPRLREAARRAEKHRKRAAAGGDKAAAHAAEAGLGTRRLLGSALVPLGLLLGPLLGLFLWLPERAAPDRWSPPPGIAFEVRTEVDGARAETVRLKLPEGFTTGEPTPEVREVPPVRQVLEELRERWRTESVSLPPGLESPDVRYGAGDVVRSLEEFLDRGTFPVSFVWVVRPPETFNGRARVAVEAGDDVVEAPVVLGRRSAPDVTTQTSDEYPYRRMVRREGRGTVLAVETVYPVPSARKVLVEVGGWSFGWLAVYLACYLPAMFGFKRWLGLP